MLQKFICRLYPGMLSAAVVAAILWLTLAPHPLPDVEVGMFANADKVAHALMFGALAFALIVDRELLLGRRYDALSGMPSRRDSVAMSVIFLAVVLFGGAIELLQDAMHLGRGASWGDWAADAAGAGAFALIGPKLATWLLFRG